MDIHAPDRPVHSWKDLFVHIGIVTVGILIALGLDGAREHFRERRLVLETRDAVHYEMQANDGHMVEEMRKVTAFRDAMKQIVDALPGNLQANPAQVVRQLNGLYNPGYFLAANSWQAALSTGALAHMKTDEVAAYAYAAEGVARYSALQTSAEQEETVTKAFFTAYPQPTGPQLAEGIQHLMLLYKAEDALAFVGPQVKDDMDRALRASQ